MDDERPHSPLDDHRRRRRHPGRRARPGDVAVLRRRAPRNGSPGSSARRRPKPKKSDLAGGILARPAAIDLGRPSVLDPDDPQRREPEPALRTGRRQPDVPIVPVPGRGPRPGGDRRRRRVPAADLRDPRRVGYSWRPCRSSGCCGAGVSGSSNSSRPCPRRSS